MTILLASFGMVRTAEHLAPHYFALLHNDPATPPAIDLPARMPARHNFLAIKPKSPKGPAAALSPPYSKTGLTDIEDIVPFIRHLVSDGWWITGQTILINGGYTTQ